MPEELPDLVQDLMRPEAYGPGASPVTLHTTHASWVFLVGNDVWKVKRPVDLGFLDFRTIEARRQDCEDEVRLNRRLAPDVYLDVVPIGLTPTGYSLVGDGATVDWAVHMRRLPDDASAAALLARNRLEPRALNAVAEHFAAFLQAARATPSFGTREALNQNVEENFDQVVPFVSDLLDQQTFDDVRAFQRKQLADGWNRFDRRITEGRVREGHGDLRLEHVYLLPSDRGPETPIIIDCIEFNERFRCGDAAAEIAFLAMELEAAGRPDLAAGFIARFVEASDDYGVLDFYLSYRAWVRGKVTAFVANDPTTTALREPKRQEARRCFALARAYSGVPLDRPFMIVVGGVIGSGKSALAAALGQELAAPIVSSDRTRKLAARLPLRTRADPSLYDKPQRDRIYAEIIRRARDVIGAGRGVILDASFSTHRWRQDAAAAALAAGANLVFLEARSPGPVLRQRLAARRKTPSISDADESLLEPFLGQYQAVGPADPRPYFGVDTSGPLELAVREALRHLIASGIPGAADLRRF